jgi:tetratricopeptide (TPR) repeat protein
VRVFEHWSQIWSRPWRYPLRFGCLALGCCGLAAGIGLLVWRAAQLPAAERALQDGYFDQARLRLNRCLSWSPGDPAVLALAARLERVEGHYETAAAHLEACQARPDAHARCALEAALLRVQRGDLAEEGLLLQRIDPGDPETPWIWEALARPRLDAMQFRQALVCLDAWLKLQPDCVRALELRGRALEYVRGQEEAVAMYERALTLDPARLTSRLRLIDILLGKERLKQAATHVDYLLNHFPEHTDVQLVAGLCAGSEGRPDQARECFLRALAAEPNNFRALYQLGKLEIESAGRAAEAERWLTRALRLRPYDMQIHYNLAKCYDLLGGRQQESAFHQAKFDALKKDNKRLDDLLNTEGISASTDAKTLTEVGTLYLALGQQKLGHLWLNKALRFRPEYEPALRALSNSTRKAERPQ